MIQIKSTKEMFALDDGPMAYCVEGQKKWPKQAGPIAGLAGRPAFGQNEPWWLVLSRNAAGQEQLTTMNPFLVGQFADLRSLSANS